MPGTPGPLPGRRVFKMPNNCKTLTHLFSQVRAGELMFKERNNALPEQIREFTGVFWSGHTLSMWFKHFFGVKM